MAKKAKTPAKKAKKVAPKTAPGKARRKSTGKVESVKIRMYRAGTGDCFILQFRNANNVVCNMMIDCGCIQGGRKDFEPIVDDINKLTSGVIDILVVTHEHADHINGFQSVSDLFDEIEFRKVWFSWTEDENDDFANDLRKNHSKLKLALQAATTQLKALVTNKYYQNNWKDDYYSALMVNSKTHFINSLTQVDALNLEVLGATGKVPSMTRLFKDFNVIKENTEVEYFRPGDLIKNVEGLTGIRIFVLGPPRDMELLNLTEEEGETYEKREHKSKKDFAFAEAILGDGQSEILPFDPEYELTLESELKKDYTDNAPWRQIEHDWLYAAGSLALRYEGSINNTSFVLAIQFEDTEKVLLFPGDAEFGNWKSWHHNLEWKITVDKKPKIVDANYLLTNTVFYKVAHHCSQNGSASKLGVELMKHEELCAMGPLDFRKINTGWLNTMPNDLLCASLISKTKGKFFFSGDYRQILPNIKTERVTVTKANEDRLIRFNEKFDGKIYVECEVEG